MLYEVCCDGIKAEQFYNISGAVMHVCMRMPKVDGPSIRKQVENASIKEAVWVSHGFVNATITRIE